jgi:MFS family permease
MLILGRLINGLGAGLLLAILPIYLSEIATSDLRGFIGGFTMV